jgi:hypothetical protein
VDWKQERKEKKDQPVGGYCKGASVEECRAIFGNGLEMVCSTCPD